MALVMSDSSTTPVSETVEMELDTIQCAQVALYMYHEWEKAMQPPLYTYIAFPAWLKRLESQREKN